MGYVTCGIHRGTRCCWACDCCPKCDEIGPLLLGDYCRACTAKIRAAGGVWQESCKDYVTPSAAGQTSLLAEGVRK
jgi:hypothetical protein